MAEQRKTVKENCPEDGKDREENLVRVEEASKEGDCPEQETIIEGQGSLDCPVCLQPCSYPVKLKCGHIFCFLCIKGVAFRSRRCALCRQDVDLSYFDDPVVVNFSGKPTKKVEEDSSDSGDKYQWYYEGRHGWWQYEESSSAELEKAHKDGQRSCDLLIAGFLYFVDFENMVQFRKTEPGRRRRIKRDVVDAEKKGVAGLRVRTESARRPPARPGSESGGGSSNGGSGRRRDTPGSGTPATPDLLPVFRLVIGSPADDENNSQQRRNSSSS